jgi:hypothetical protein
LGYTVSSRSIKNVEKSMGLSIPNKQAALHI